MSTKKRLITRMAVWAAGVLAAALLVTGGALLAHRAEREQWEADRAQERREVLERSRKYLGELAKRIERLPVDPALVAEVESRYFDERPGGEMRVWAMGTGGEFLFGVPRETFSRLNAVYDREVTPRLEQGAFLDRQAFLLGQVDEDFDFATLEEPGEAGASMAAVLQRLRRHADGSSGAFVLSSPLKSADGAALGSLYLRREAPERDWYRGEGPETVAGAAAGVAALAFLFLWILLPTWVYVDASERRVRRAWLFAFLTVLSSLVGLVVYLIARPEEGRALVCPDCAREVNGGAFCPHCGRDLSSSFCATCRYPLKPDWAFCPSCRTEIKPAPPATSE
jgi:hypothetical protein